MPRLLVVEDERKLLRALRIGLQAEGYEVETAASGTEAGERLPGPGFGAVGLGLLVLVMVSWEVVLSKGQEWDWFGDPVYRVQALAAVFAAGPAALAFRELRRPSPLVDFRPLADRTFAAGSVIIALAFAVLYAQTVSLPGLLQSLFGYDATHSGLVLSPSGVAAVLLLPVVAFLLDRGTDARKLVIAGLALMAAGNYRLSRLNLGVGPWDVVWPRVVTVAGLALLVTPLNVAVYQRVPLHLRGAAVGLFSLLRNEGGASARRRARRCGSGGSSSTCCGSTSTWTR